MGEEEAIPTDDMRLIVRMIDERTGLFCLLCSVVYAELVRMVGLRKSCRKRWVRWDGDKVTEGRARIGDSLDLDVRRPLSKRGTLEALQRGSNQPVVGARCHSNAAAREKEGPLPSLVPVLERPCSALPLGGGMILALDHLLVRLLIIIQPWIGTQALGHRHFGHPPPLGPPAAYQGSLPSRGPVESSRIIFILVALLGAVYSITSRQREGQKQRQP